MQSLYNVDQQLVAKVCQWLRNHIGVVDMFLHTSKDRITALAASAPEYNPGSEGFGMCAFLWARHYGQVSCRAMRHERRFRDDPQLLDCNNDIIALVVSSLGFSAW